MLLAILFMKKQKVLSPFYQESKSPYTVIKINFLRNLCGHHSRAMFMPVFPATNLQIHLEEFLHMRHIPRGYAMMCNIV